VTTVHKAKEMRPWIERLIRKAMIADKIQSNRFIKAQLFTSMSMKKLTREIAPRFEEEGRSCGFTRIEEVGRRKPDRARMAIIEIMGNPIQQWEKAQDEQAAEELGNPNFWQWEHKILKQEQTYFKEQLDQVQDTIEQEIDAFIGDQMPGSDSPAQTQVRGDIETKYAAKKQFLLNGLRRAIIEEE